MTPLLDENGEQFVRWALDDARTIEERYTVELLVEEMLSQWHNKNQTGVRLNWEKRVERNRQRQLNPAYQPIYSEKDLRRIAEIIPEKTSWGHNPHDSRPVRDLKALRFLTALEQIGFDGEVTDLSPLLDLPRLRILGLNSLTFEDYGPLAQLSTLRELTLRFAHNPYRFSVNWPEVTGLENLTQLESLHLTGNLLTFKPGLIWPNVRRATLDCTPLPARSVRDLPQLPACEFLTLAGVERLDGIEKFPRLRNLTLTGSVRDFSPLEALPQLTCFTCNAAEPLDVSPLTRVPSLHVLAFQTHHKYGLDKAKPRDFSPLVEAPHLRRLEVTGCAPVETEVAGLNAGFQPCDDLFLLDEPRPVPPLKLIVAPSLPRLPDTSHSPDQPELIDLGLALLEVNFVKRFVARTISKRLGCTDWGEIHSWGAHRHFNVTVESFAVVEKFTLIVEAIREALSCVRYSYDAGLSIHLKSPRLEPTPAQVEMEKQFREEEAKADSERRWQETAEYLERLHRHELKKQEGSPIKPEEFAVPAPTPLPSPPWENDDDEDESDEGSSDIAVKKKPDPPPSWLDDDHPLADNYSLGGAITVAEAWFYKHRADLVAYLMRREPDVIMPDEPKK